MSRPTANEQLSALIDGKLTEGELTELETELERDPALRAELAELKAAVAFLRTHGPVQAPDDFQERILAAVADEPMPGGWWRWLRRPFGLPIEGLAVALVAALVLIIALPLGLQSGDQMKGLEGDPYGFVRGEDLGAVTAADDAREKEGASPVGGAIAPSSSLDRTSGESNALGPTAKVSSRAAPSAAPAPAPPKADKVASKSTAEPVAGKGDDGGDLLQGGVADAEPQAAPAYGSTQADPAQAQAPTGRAIYAYRILTYDTEALTRLQRIAARYRGRVVDAQGRPVDKAELVPGQSYSVEIPSSALAAFGDDLRTLGMVTELPDPGSWVGSTVRVQVSFEVVQDRSGKDLDEAAPANAQ